VVVKCAHGFFSGLRFILTDPGEAQQEVSAFYEAFFQSSRAAIRPEKVLRPVWTLIPLSYLI
jgi:hypothetical protein